MSDASRIGYTTRNTQHTRTNRDGLLTLADRCPNQFLFRYMISRARLTSDYPPVSALRAHESNESRYSLSDVIDITYPGYLDDPFARSVHQRPRRHGP